MGLIGDSLGAERIGRQDEPEEARARSRRRRPRDSEDAVDKRQHGHEPKPGSDRVGGLVRLEEHERGKDESASAVIKVGGARGRGPPLSSNARCWIAGLKKAREPGEATEQIVPLPPYSAHTSVV